MFYKEHSLERRTLRMDSCFYFGKSSKEFKTKLNFLQAESDILSALCNIGLNAYYLRANYTKVNIMVLYTKDETILPYDVGGMIIFSTEVCSMKIRMGRRNTYGISKLLFYDILIRLSVNMYI